MPSLLLDLRNVFEGHYTKYCEIENVAGQQQGGNTERSIALSKTDLRGPGTNHEGFEKHFQILEMSTTKTRRAAMLGTVQRASVIATSIQSLRSSFLASQLIKKLLKTSL